MPDKKDSPQQPL